MVEYVLQVKNQKKNTNPKKIPKKLFIKLKTNIDRFKRIDFNQKMVLANSPGEKFVYFMKYYPLMKKYFDDYQRQNRFQLFFSKSNIIRTTIKKEASKDPEYVYKNIQFIIDAMFEKNNKIYLGLEPYTIFSSLWDQKVYKTNNPNIYQIDVDLILAKGEKLSSSDTFQLTCSQRKIDIANDVDLIFNNIHQYIKSFGTSTEKKKNGLTEWNPEDDKTPIQIARLVKTIDID